MIRFKSGVLALLGALALLLSLTVVASAAPPTNQVCRDAGCTITQSGPADAACIQSGPNTTCTITQTGTGEHVARCIQRSTQPDATQTCVIRQTNTGGDNRAEVTQLITQATCEPPPSTTTCRQDGTQSAIVEQHNGSGKDSANSNQRLRQRIGKQDDEDNNGDNDQGNDEDNNNDNDDRGGANFLTETQNGLQRSTICQNRGTAFALFCGSPDVPAASGRVSATLNQLSSQFARTGATATPQSSVVQNQHLTLKGHIDLNSTGVARSRADQRYSQKLRAPLGTTQFQGPDEFCCSNQSSNPSDTFDIEQRADQRANPDATQFDATGGNCDTSGSCDVNQRIVQNGKTQTNHVSGKNVHTGFDCINPPGPPTGCSPNGGGEGG